MCAIPYTELPGSDARNADPADRHVRRMPGEEGKPVFIVYRHEDIQKMLRDNETFSSNVVIQIFGDVFGHGVMLGMDEPVHGRLRSLVTKAFTQKALARWEDEIVGRIGNELIDRFAQPGQARFGQDVHLSVSDPHHRRVARPAGEDFPQFQRWSISMLSFTVNPERGQAASQALVDYFNADPAGPAGPSPRRPDQQPRRGRDRRDKLVGRGHLTRSSGCCCPPESRPPIGRWAICCSALLTNPDQLDAVRADRSLIPQAIEEAVRWDAPLLNITGSRPAATPNSAGWRFRRARR